MKRTSSRSVSWMTIVLVSGVSIPGVASAVSDNGTLTLGHAPAASYPCSGSSGSLLTSGFSAFVSTGSYSPTGLTGGVVIVGLFDLVSCPLAVGFSQLRIAGFSSDPGSNWLTSITSNGVTRTPGTATYDYTSSTGTASWTWTTTILGFISPPAGANLSCTIVHN